MYRGDQGEVIRLPYHHFSIVMNQARQTCMLAASNADYNEDQRDERPRKAFGGEDWRLDPRVPAELQIEDKEFYRPAGRIDRGHIVRREDNCWGASRLEREYANADSYHWTNCTPQHEAFNQERARKPEYKEVVGLWGALESHLVRQLNAVGRRATIFAGPILAHDDPGRDFGSGHFQYPTRFWKVVCVARQERGAAKLYVYGFILDQGDVIRRFGIERIDVGAFAAHQRSLAAIQDETGLRFAPEILAGDVMSGESEPHGLEGSGSIRGIPAGGEADEA
jgi:endonuclease G